MMLWPASSCCSPAALSSLITLAASNDADCPPMYSPRTLSTFKRPEEILTALAISERNFSRNSGNGPSSVACNCFKDIDRTSSRRRDAVSVASFAAFFSEFFEGPAAVVPFVISTSSSLSCPAECEVALFSASGLSSPILCRCVLLCCSKHAALSGYSAHASPLHATRIAANRRSNMKSVSFLVLWDWQAASHKGVLAYPAYILGYYT
mmetsp:Transcript_9418/g.15214  ORF Transcript_9418/g.15214 Transcript_9418/m.15214 type:complete len:208 (-) Transcript_9418:21-644(-)